MPSGIADRQMVTASAAHPSNWGTCKVMEPPVRELHGVTQEVGPKRRKYITVVSFSARCGLMAGDIKDQFAFAERQEHGAASIEGENPAVRGQYAFEAMKHRNAQTQMLALSN